jgi:hypothetical protein
MTFSTLSTGSGKLMISHDGRRVVTLVGDEAVRLSERLERAADENERQLALARATGNFKRGNER